MFSLDPAYDEIRINVLRLFPVKDIVFLKQDDGRVDPTVVSYFVSYTDFDFDRVASYVKSHATSADLPLTSVFSVDSIPLEQGGGIDLFALNQLGLHRGYVSRPLGPRTDNDDAPDRRRALLHSNDVLSETAPSSLMEALREAATSSKSIHLIERGGIEQQISYLTLSRDSVKAAHALMSLGFDVGAPVLLVSETLEDFIRGFWAIVATGATPIILPRNEIGEISPRFSDAVQRFPSAQILCSKSLRTAVDEVLDALGFHPRVYVSGTFGNEAPNNTIMPAFGVKGEDIAVYVLTSGSTGGIKAVSLSHYNIFNQALGSINRLQLTTKDRSLNWMPLDHVGGLIFFHLRDVILACDQVHVDTKHMLARPTYWLELLAQRNVTITWAPNFAYQLLSSSTVEAKLNPGALDHVRTFLNGAEPVKFETCRSFIERYSYAGVSAAKIIPVFGMAETSSGFIYSNGFDVTLDCDGPTVSVGYPVGGNTIRIVREDGSLCYNGQVGSVEISGPTITQGYYDDDGATRAAIDNDGWLHTNDIGYINDRGLTVTGRSSGVFRINGRTTYAHELEALIESLDGVEPATAAVFDLEVNEEPQLIAVFSAQISVDENQLVKHIRAKMYERYGFVPSKIIPVSTSVIHKTTGGKIQHKKIRSDYLAGKFGTDYSASFQAHAPMTARCFNETWVERHVTVDAPLTPSHIYVINTGTTATSIKRHLVDNAHHVTSSLIDRIPDANSMEDNSAVLLCFDIEEQSLQAATSELNRAAQRCSMIIELLRDIDAMNSNGVRLVVVTNNSSSLHVDTPAEPDPLLPMLATAALEHVGLDTLRVAVEGDYNDHFGDICAELFHFSKERSVTWTTAGKRYVRRLSFSRGSEAPAFDIMSHDNPVIVLAGGLGGIGHELIANQFFGSQATLYLCGRTTNSDASHQVTVLKNYHDALFYSQCDFTDADAVNKLLHDIEVKENRRVTGIVLLTGEFVPEMLVQTPNFSFPKTSATLVTLNALQANRDAWLLMFSSVNAWLGGTSSGGYGIDNALAELMIAVWKRQGINARSVAFTEWSGIGMANGKTGGLFASAKGFLPLSETDALEQLSSALRSDINGRLLIGLDADNSYIASLMNRNERSSCRRRADFKGNSSPKASETASKTSSFELGERLGSQHYLEVVRGIIQRIWNDIFKGLNVEPSSSFFSLGGSSLIAARISAEVAEALNVSINLHDFASDPSFEDFVRLTSERLSLNSPMNPNSNGSNKADVSPAAFPTTILQKAYLAGRSDNLPLGGVGTYIYFEFASVGLDPIRLQRALADLITRHDSLRTIFEIDGHQRVRPELEYFIRINDFRGQHARDAIRSLRSVRLELNHWKGDAQTGPLFLVQLSLLPGNRTRLHLGLDALIADAWSALKLLTELGELYESTEPVSERIRSTFDQYVTLSGLEPSLDDVAYWEVRANTFVGGPELPYLTGALDIKRPRFDRTSFLFDNDAWARLQKLCSNRGLSPTVVILTSYIFSLSQWSRRQNFELNVTTFDRSRFGSQFAETLGDFTALCLFHADLRESVSFSEMARRIQGDLWNDLSHGSMHGIEVARRYGSDNPSSPNRVRYPVVYTSALDLVDPAQEANTWRLGKPTYGLSNTPQVLLDHHVFRTSNGLYLCFDYVKAAFPGEMVQTLFGKHIETLRSLVENDEAWDDLPTRLLPINDQKVLLESNNTQKVFPTETPVGLHSLFLKSAGAHPNNLAIVQHDSRLTYCELDRQARAIGTYLVGQGIKVGDRVVVALPKGGDQIAAVIGTLYAGAVYVPVDPTAPRERILQLINRCDAKLVFAEPQLNQQTLKSDVPFSDLHSCREVDLHFVPHESSKDETAYIIYTSGSTGVPKGVEVTHWAARNTILDVNDRVMLSSADAVFGISSLAFDLSVYDIFGTLAVGACLVLPDEKAVRAPAQWVQLITTAGVTVWNSAPPLMQMLVEHAGRNLSALTTIRAVLLSGDWIPVSLARVLRNQLPNCRLISLGGATEAAIWSIWREVEDVPDFWTSIPYGKPLTNQRFYVFDEHYNTRPIWSVGKLYISGDGLAKGYWGDLTTTRKAFTDHPVSGERIYCTGDLGYYLPDGDILFLGREDSQVKINGIRVELGEVEEVLASHPRAKIARIGLFAQKGLKRELGAYVVIDEATRSPDASSIAIHDHALTRLRLARHQISPRPGAIILPPPPSQKQLMLDIFKRRSHRKFSIEPISLEELSRVLYQICPLQVSDNILLKFPYPSASSIYPVEVLVACDNDAVTGLLRGIYRLARNTRELIPLSEDMNSTRLFAGNSNAPAGHFSIHLIADVELLSGFYADAYRYCLLEAGTMMQILCERSEQFNVGLCPVGEIDLPALRTAACLIDSEMVLASLVGGKSLAPSDDNQMSTDLLDFLRSKLPSYMIPSRLRIVDAIPLTSNGKVDWSQLGNNAQPISSQINDPMSHSQFPSGLVIRRIIGDILQVAVQDGDNLFDLGADSLLIVRMHRQIEEELRASFDIMLFFEIPDILSLEIAIMQRLSGNRFPEINREAEFLA